MDKRKSGAASMAPRKKKVKISNVAGRIPISAFFKRIVRPTPEAEDAVPAGGNHVEEIDGEEPMDVTESKSSCSVRMVQGTINFDHANETKLKVLRRVTGFHMLRSRELRGGLPQRQQQQVLRDILKSFAALGVAPQPVLQPNQWISCMEFDTDGVILATGSSNGMIALYDFDEYFHRLLVLRNLQAKPLRQATNDAATHGTFKTVRPIHILNTALEIKRIRWNPMDQDILACSFTARNEIHLYNLKKFPTQPFRVLKAPTRPSSGYYDFLFTKSRTSNAPCIVGADVDGSIRMWDTHVPSKPVWVVVNSRDVGSITSMCLCAGQQYLICGTDRGWLLIFDTWNIVVPAFGQRPVPKRVAQYDLLVHLRAAAPTAANNATAALGGGVVSVQLVPNTAATIACQLLNDWIVVVDALRRHVLQLHTVLRGAVAARHAGPSSSDPTTFSFGEHDTWPSSNGPSTRIEASTWKLHRCMGSFMFGGAMFTTGFASDNGLYTIGT
ncbi:hypothetical protein, variant 3 [Aphanomyces invadans]|uniref:Anaphase-promoting complex subunit 4 WD40 domain-containing protein n=1 Tax=Aphanomyces invadans TaxID=157072 RepID=A0A024TV59_9STRA|nr:hypothetical protein, variant 3 [Aphanomyces invadans]ETV97859.1 hypothetical protein, variant 3 [Aphanomyces invadans]|eukprot:XP_008873420.1 hypothetical protein, variant 3 [Aphanomyces invadans]